MVAVAAIAMLAVSGLSGCVGDKAPSPNRPSASVTASPSGSAAPASPSATPTASPTPTPTASVPITLTCDQLVSRQDIYDFNPNFGLQSDYTPEAGSTAASIVARKGVACSWLHQTSRDTLRVAVANLSAAEIAARQNELKSSSQPVSEFGSNGYFSAAGGVGVAEAFTGSSWIVASSSFFGEPADAAAIVAAALKGLRG